MDTRPPERPEEPSTAVLARLTVTSAEDPFGPGDPLEVARLVRRTLAAAGRRALDVTALIVVADTAIPNEALGRFVRRALGPHAAGVASWIELVAHDLPHEARIDAGLVAPGQGSMGILVVIGPGHSVTGLCVGPPAARTGRSAGGRPG